MTARNGRRADDDTTTNKFETDVAFRDPAQLPRPTSWGKILGVAAILLAFIAFFASNA